MLAKILAQPVDAFTLFKDKVELVDVKKEPPNKKDKNDSRGGGFGGKSDSSKKKGGSKGGKTMSKKSDDSAGKEGSAEAPVIMRLVDYGISVSGSSIFNPATLALSMKDATTGAWEPVEITPWTKPAEIPDSVKPYLRNYTSVLNADNATTSADDMTPPPEKAQGKNNKKTSGGKEVGI
ncbi:uncharacterized protein LOC118433399 [Folsomia candida]|nr:uncharacterized protein LOC118433399 [Folsomia candida]